MLKVQVIDSGAGIGQLECEQLQRAIDGEPLLAGSAGAPVKGKGLYICRKILENFGGTISFFSYGKRFGSTFMFSMKMSLPEQAAGVADLQVQPQLLPELHMNNSCS
jgi:K+-sensing histidine kinase KdpD